GHAVEGDDAHVGVEEQVECELLLLRPRSQTPGLDGSGEHDEPVALTADECRLAARAEHGELVGGELDRGAVDTDERLGRAAVGGGEDVVDQLARHLDGGPTEWTVALGAT